MPQLRVAVAGAGIAGLAFAAALHRAGIDCHVYEQAERLAEVGAGVQVAPNATRLLHRLGLGDRLRAVAVAPEAIEMRRWDDGTTLQRTPLGGLCRRRFGAPYYAVHRADLHDCLLSLVPGDRVHLGARITAVTQTADEARLHLSDGTAVNGVVELRQALLRRPGVFVRTMTENLLTYALGRGLTADDMPTVRAIMRGAAGQNYRFQDLVQGIVTSTPFQMRLKAEPQAERVAAR